MDPHPLIEILLVIILIVYVFTLFRLGKGFSRQKPVQPPGDLPAVTVVISLHNEEQNIPPLISCLENIEYPAEKLEIILINDRSSDRTPDLLQNLTGRPEKYKIIHIGHVNPEFAPKKYAIDLAIRQSAGELILLTDADGRPGKDWVRAMMSEFTPETGMVLGFAPYSRTPGEGSFAFNLLKTEYFSHAAVSAATTGLGYPATCVGTNLAYRKSVYQQLGGFGIMRHIHTGDDDLFLQRVREETDWSIRYALDPRTFVPNAPPASWKQFYNQRLRYASKGFVYPARFTLALSAFYFFNLICILAIISAAAGLTAPVIVVLLLFSKIAADFRFLTKAAQTFTYALSKPYLPVASLLHIPYVLYFGLKGNLNKFEWGGLIQKTGR